MALAAVVQVRYAALACAFVAHLALSPLSGAPAFAQEHRSADNPYYDPPKRGTLNLNSASDNGGGQIRIRWELLYATATVDELCVHWRVLLRSVLWQAWQSECESTSSTSGTVDVDTNHTSVLAQVYLNLHYGNTYPSSFTGTVDVMLGE